MEHIIKTSCNWAKQYGIASKSLPHKSHPVLATSLLGQDSVCFNTDGSVKVEDGFALAGGLVRDSSGASMFGFCRYLGCVSIFEVELWTILDGLYFLLDSEIRCILIQVDSSEAVTVIQEEFAGVHKSILIMRIH